MTNEGQTYDMNDTHTKTECLFCTVQTVNSCTQFPWHRCINDLTIERFFDSQATWVVHVLGLFLKRYPLVFVQPGTGRRPVDRYRN